MIKRKLSELCIEGKGSYGIAASAVAYSEDLYTYLRITDINDDGTLNKSDLKSVDDENASSYILKPNDIVFARTGGSTGRNYFYDGHDGEFVYAGFLIKFSIDPEKVNPKFIKYYCLSEPYKNWVQSFNTGSTRGNINAQTYANMEIDLPSRDQQDLLVKILSSLDDKIELNNKINANLEQQAQALFKSWFVDFENSSDFTEKKLDEVTVNLRERILDQNTPVLSAVNTGCLQRSDDYFSKQVYSKDISKYILVKIGDFAYNPARINIGSIGINDFDYDGCVSPVYVAFSVDPAYKSFFKYYFKSNSFKEETKTRASGSVRQSLNYDDFAKIQINYPSRELASKFEAFYTSIESSMKKIKKENETLISIRDTLLPKLMNGEIEL